ncbi:MAG TPA: class I SAM-dependent methyltransferase [Opitutaceae bacterium]|nr:class I SAM-dependent methyltransferase [Opitutaceae bacterium]
MPQPSLPIRALRALARATGLETCARAAYHRLQRWRHPPIVWPSETSKCRARLAPWCTGYGLDLGFGGDPIVEHAIRMDFPQPYSDVGKQSVQLGGKAEDLYWFRDNCLDFIYSSHLLEDFADTRAVLAEWLRVLKPGGRLILYLPDEQVYRRHCAATHQPYNTHHQHADFSLEFVKRHLAALGGTRVLHENPHVEIYSWEIVTEKLATT